MSLNAMYVSLNAMYVSLIAMYMSLNAMYVSLNAMYVSLNAMYVSLNAMYVSLNAMYMSLNAMYVSLNAMYMSLNAMYVSLNTMYMSLNAMYMSLNTMYMSLNAMYMSLNAMYVSLNAIDCVVGDGSNYRGDIRIASDGWWCGYWFQEGSEEGYSPETFPDAGLDRNYCRNPDGSAEGPFCITKLPGAKTACEVASCDCYVDGTTSYRGQVNVTGTGQQCLDWADEMVQRSLGYMGLSEAQIAAAGLDGNYCRDPTGSGTLECFVAPGGGLFGIVLQEACRIDECSTQYYVPTPVTCYSCAADEDCDQDQDDLVTGGGQSRETLCENGACWISWKTSTDGKYGGHIRSCQHEDLVCTQEYMQETCTEDGNTKECLKCCQADRCNGELLQGSISAGARASIPNMVMLLAFLAAMFCSRS
uniref:Kringle domain-containing protein n=1 Tax=Branchiostoma floridae TaxID=7739 RepID=C3Z668_BRAFL|eukprot:XP_002595982.1 hypothetical protein BRAFLDRAFT_96755 [Branchiostoma floridae]